MSDLKCCSTCKAAKAIAEFNKHKQAKDGLMSYCRACQKIFRIDYRRRNAEAIRQRDKKYRDGLDKAILRARKYKWATSAKGIASRTAYDKSERNRELLKIRSARQRLKDKDKRVARSKLAFALRSGLIERQPCGICGASKSDGHHHDYSKPLDVQWLCRKHHLAEHRRMRNE